MINPSVLSSELPRGTTAPGGQMADKGTPAGLSFAALLEGPVSGNAIAASPTATGSIAKATLPVEADGQRSGLNAAQPDVSSETADFAQQIVQEQTGVGLQERILRSGTVVLAAPAIQTQPAGAQSPIEVSSAPGSQKILQRTFGFSDLGAFGLQFFADAQAAAPSADGGGLKPSRPVASSDGSDPAGAQQPDNLAQGQAPLLEHETGGVDPSSTHDLSVSSITRSVSLHADGPWKLGAAGSSEVPTTPEGEWSGSFFDRGGAGKILPIAPGGSNFVNLVVSGPNDMLSIAARAQGGTAADAAKIRGLLEATAAEFDMKIADLQFNGQPSQPLANGDARGSRTR